MCNLTLEKLEEKNADFHVYTDESLLIAILVFYVGQLRLYFYIVTDIYSVFYSVSEMRTWKQNERNVMRRPRSRS